MIRGKYLRERKAIRTKRRQKNVILLIILLLLAKIIFSAFSLYESQADSTADVDIAFYVLNVDEPETQDISLDNLNPNGEAITCSFSVSNWKDIDEVTNIAETDMEYFLKIRTTTNLPLKYELYKNDDNQTVSVIDTRTEIVYEDESNTFFKRLINTASSNAEAKLGVTAKGEFAKLMAGTDYYTLKVSLPDTPENRRYDKQNIIEGIEITVESKQKTE